MFTSVIAQKMYLLLEANKTHFENCLQILYAAKLLIPTYNYVILFETLE